jgi:hypothetical protein
MSPPPVTKRSRRVPAAECLRYSFEPVSRTTVRRQYARWRQQHGIAQRCDSELCVFHSQPLLWLGQALPVILDHINGNSYDNRPKNLRYLCPNCDSQLATRGGLNRGRVAARSEGGYVLASRDGRKHHHLIADTGTYKLTGHAPTVVVSGGSSKT